MKIKSLLIPGLLLLILPLAGVAAAATLSLAEADQMLKKGLALSREDRAAEAIPFVRQGLTTRQLLLPNNDPRIADALDTVGRVYYNSGNYSLAEHYFRDAMTAVSNISGRTSLDAALQLGNVAASLREQRKYRDAEKLVLDSLSLRSSLLVPNDPYIAGGLDNLGRTYLATGRYTAAEKMFAESRDIFAQNFGPQDSGTQREAAILEETVKKHAALMLGLEILGVAPLLIATLALLSELPAIKRNQTLASTTGFAILVAGYGMKAFAIYFGAFTLMPLLMWILPSPLDASQIRPVAGLIGGASGLGTIVVFTLMLRWLRLAIQRSHIFGSEPSLEPIDKL